MPSKGSPEAVPALAVALNEIQSPMAVVVLGGLLTAVVLNMLVVPALFLHYGVDRPDTAGAAASRRKPEPVLERVG